MLLSIDKWIRGIWMYKHVAGCSTQMSCIYFPVFMFEQKLTTISRVATSKSSEIALSTNTS